MAHVDVHHRVYLGAGHHRQPRNSQAWIEPSGASAFDTILGSPIRVVADSAVSFMLPANPAELTAHFVFWSRSSTSRGTTQTDPNFFEIAGSENLTLIAWYYLPGGGTGVGDGTAELIDAYSVAAGGFINDDFVHVTSDPSLTHEANVGGDVPTAVAETIVAYPSIASTAESFDKWITSGDGSTAANETLSCPARADGFAFATYDHQSIVVPRPNLGSEAQGVVILDGIINDAPGHILVNGHPVPVDPGWGSLIKQLFTLLGIQGDARGLSKEGAGRIQSAAAHELGAVARQMVELAGKAQR